MQNKIMKILLTIITVAWLGFANAAVVAGNPNGSITLAFVYDYQCGYCHEMYPIVQELTQKFPDLKVRMMPVAVINQTSVYEAAAAIAATNTNQFWDFSNQVMAEGALTDEQVAAILKQLGLDTVAFQKTMHSQAVEEQLTQGQALMAASGHKGTPLFVIYPSALDPSHSVVVSGAQSLQAMESAIQDVQQKMQSLN